MKGNNNFFKKLPRQQNAWSTQPSQQLTAFATNEIANQNYAQTAAVVGKNVVPNLASQIYPNSINLGNQNTANEVNVNVNRFLETFPLYQRVAGNGACYFNAVMVAAFNKCQGNEILLEEFKQKIFQYIAQIQSGFNDQQQVDATFILSFLDSFNHSTDRNQLNQMFFVNDRDDLITRMVRIFVVPNHKEFIKKINLEISRVSGDDIEAKKTQLTNQISIYGQAARSADKIADIYRDEDIDDILYEILPDIFLDKGENPLTKINVVKYTKDISLRYSEEEAKALEANNTINLYNASGTSHFDIIYSITDDEIVRDYNAFKEIQSSELKKLLPEIKILQQIEEIDENSIFSARSQDEDIEPVNSSDDLLFPPSGNGSIITANSQEFSEDAEGSTDNAGDLIVRNFESPFSSPRPNNTSFANNLGVPSQIPEDEFENDSDLDEDESLEANSKLRELYNYLTYENIRNIKTSIRSIGLDINAVDNNGYTALHIAAEEGNLEVVKVLFEFEEFDINAVDNDGYTALRIAAEDGNLEVFKALLSHPNINQNSDLNDNYFLNEFPNQTLTKDFVDQITKLVTDKRLQLAEELKKQSEILMNSEDLSLLEKGREAKPINAEESVFEEFDKIFNSPKNQDGVSEDYEESEEKKKVEDVLLKRGLQKFKDSINQKKQQEEAEAKAKAEKHHQQQSQKKGFEKFKKNIELNNKQKEQELKAKEQLNTKLLKQGFEKLKDSAKRKKQNIKEVNFKEPLDLNVLTKYNFEAEGSVENSEYRKKAKELFSDNSKTKYEEFVIDGKSVLSDLKQKYPPIIEEKKIKIGKEEITFKLDKSKNKPIITPKILSLKRQGSKHYYAEFGGMIFDEGQKTASESKPKIFNDANLFMANFRNCEFRDVDFSKIDPEIFKTIKFNDRCVFEGDCIFPRGFEKPQNSESIDATLPSTKVSNPTASKWFDLKIRKNSAGLAG
jgi:hypothetical protein